MMMGGGGELHQQLRNLCFNTDWKYAVFWKLKHQPQMMLSWEDAYCNDKEKNDCSGINNWFTNANDNLKDEWYPRDHLGLAIANMSYRVYSIREGYHSDGWKSQFTAGIRITKDLKLVNHIREIFFELHAPSPCVWTKVETIIDRQENENLISDLVQSKTCNDQSWGEFMPTISNIEMLNNPETETNNSFKFPAGCELHEALGPTFYKQKNCFNWEMVTTETLTIDQTT
ncbi:putative transcription factor MYC/MYB, transcription factor LHW [Helianthus anomalus]